MVYWGRYPFLGPIKGYRPLTSKRVPSPYFPLLPLTSPYFPSPYFPSPYFPSRRRPGSRTHRYRHSPKARLTPGRRKRGRTSIFRLADILSEGSLFHPPSPITSTPFGGTNLKAFAGSLTLSCTLEKPSCVAEAVHQFHASQVVGVETQAQLLESGVFLARKQLHP